MILIKIVLMFPVAGLAYEFIKSLRISDGESGFSGVDLARDDVCRN